MSSSPGRGSFQKTAYIQRAIEAGNEPDSSYIKMYEDWNLEKVNKEAELEWQKDNMEYDLRTTDWILEKVRASDIYAQNLYAAMCNNDFQRNDVWPILSKKTWGCSWRYAGGVIADMQQKGDYIDWYCSGIRGDDELSPAEFSLLTEEQQKRYLQSKEYVSESFVTDEIKNDLFKLGWIVIEEKDQE